LDLPRPRGRPQEPGVVHGSASTARKLRTTGDRCATRSGSNAEADSLKPVHPGAGWPPPGTAEFDRTSRSCHRDDRQGGPEVHRDPARVRARRVVDDVIAAGRRAVGEGDRRQPQQARVSGWARWQLERVRSVRRSIKALRTPADSLRRPGAGRRRGRGPRRAARSSPICCAPNPDRAEPHEVEAFGPVSTSPAVHVGRRT